MAAVLSDVYAAAIIFAIDVWKSLLHSTTPASLTFPNAAIHSTTCQTNCATTLPAIYTTTLSVIQFTNCPNICTTQLPVSQFTICPVICITQPPVIQFTTSPVICTTHPRVIQLTICPVIYGTASPHNNLITTQLAGSRLVTLPCVLTVGG